MKKLRKTNGITLIALIITIVVLVILAGVVIMAISGNGGILNNANKAAEKYNSKASEEEELLGTLENKLKEYTGENSDKPAKEPTNVEYFSWTTTETEATITGFSDAGKEKYNAGEITELVIPSVYKGLGVTTISRSAFGECKGLTEVFIPKSVKVGGDREYGENGAFEGCSSLTKVTFEEGMETYIMRNTGITEVTIPNSVKTIGLSAFNQCIKLTTVNFRGTEAQWNAISIGSSNDPLTSATKQFNQ